ncbi:short-chain dehydrogenase [Mycolicibacterium vulneris]|nr:short-chain dehydrogenase [Mycolicibacterium vulneris]
MNEPETSTGKGGKVIEFNDQVAVVTGAGRGLGRMYALELARRGAAVVVNDLGGTMAGRGSDVAVADQVVEEITAAGGTAVASYDSVDSPEGGEAIVRAAVEQFGRLDAVISNAGIFTSIPFDELTAEDWRRMLSVHLDGGFYLSQPAYRVMKRQGYGRFVFIASSAGMFGQHLEAHYAAAKAGLIGLTNVIALEGAPHGILANTVLPFGVSRMVTETLGDPKVLEDNGFFKAIRPELVAPLVVYLASRDCEFSHQNFSACAGRFARVFIGLSEGWMAPADSTPSADDIAAHLSEITATEPFTIPGSIYDEVFGVTERLGVTT